MDTDTIPLASPVALRTADEIRALMLQQYESAKPNMVLYREYAARVAALSQEYHTARFKETFPSVKVEELVLAASLDVRETPATLDSKLGHLKQADVRRIIFDRANGQYHLFV